MSDLSINTSYSSYQTNAATSSKVADKVKTEDAAKNTDVGAAFGFACAIMRGRFQD